MSERTGFRILLAIVVFHYTSDALARIVEEGDIWDWGHMVVAAFAVPIVLIAGWRYSS